MDKFIIALIIILIFLIFVVFTSRSQVKKLYAKYMVVNNSAGITGGQLALIASEKFNLENLNISTTVNNLADAYIPKTKTLVLSESTCYNASLASIGIAAHELGHAIQDKQNHRLFGLSVVLSRITKFTNLFIIPLLVTSLIIYLLCLTQIVAPELISYSSTLFLTAFGLFILNLTVKLILIPIEYDASRKALRFLQDYNIISKNETHHIKKLLKTASYTYILSLFDGIIISGKKISNIISNNKQK